MFATIGAWFAGIWMKIAAVLAAIAAVIGLIFLYSRNQQGLGESKAKAKVADEAGKAKVKMENEAEKFRQDGARKRLEDGTF